MTREEAIDRLKGLYGNRYSEQEEALDMAIQALEQEPILDKIRAEIAEYKDDKIIHAERNEMIDIVLEIIDKYRK